jgi:hypothetical protein
MKVAYAVIYQCITIIARRVLADAASVHPKAKGSIDSRSMAAVG